MRCGHSIPQLIPTYDRRAQGPVGAPFFRLKPNLARVSRLSALRQLPPAHPLGVIMVCMDSLGSPWTHGQRPSLEWNRTIPGIKGSHTHDWFTTQLTMLYDGFEPSGPGGAFLGYTEHSFC